jgi:hypothetical protein
MAELNINGRMMVKNFKKQFKEVFGGSLRVYKGQSFAADEATLASIRAEGCKDGEFTLRANTLVGNFEEKMQEMFGIKVQVADADDKKLVDNALTLGAVGRGEVKKKAAAAAGTGERAATQTALMDWLKKECIVETDYEVYYDASSADDEEIELFISNIKAQNLDEENEKLEKMSFEAAAGFIKDEDDDLQLASKIVNAAYCTRKGIEIDDDTELYVDEQQYYINDSRDFHYEYESDIDFG